MITTKQLLAKDLMKRKLLTLHPKDKILRVKEVFETYSISHIPVMVADRVVGLISRSDFLRIQGFSRDGFDAFLTDKIMKLHNVEQYMISEIVCCKDDTPILKILDLFLVNEIHSVLVVDDKKLLGIITPHDILKQFAKELRDE